MRFISNVTVTVALLAALTVTLGAGGCGDDGGSAVDGGPDARVPTGTFSLSWTIMEKGVPKTCAEVGNPPVTIQAVPTAGGTGVVDTLTCSSMMGTTRGFPAGEYRVTVSLGQLDEVGPMIASIAVNTDTPLGVIAFDVVANGGVSFQLDVNGASGNICDPETTMDGAGIDDFVITLWDYARSACIPATFMVGEPAENYVSDCLGGAHFRCIEKTEPITVAGLIPGMYYIRIEGYEGPELCYQFDALVNVPAGGDINDEGTIRLTVESSTVDGGPMCMTP